MTPAALLLVSLLLTLTLGAEQVVYSGFFGAFFFFAGHSFLLCLKRDALTAVKVKQNSKVGGQAANQ